MDILIKGMEMPKKGDVLKLYLSDGYVGYQDEEGLHKSNVVELPEHGRLIVADALIEKLDKIVLPDDLTYTIAHGILKQIIEDAPTVLEAK